MIAAQALRVLIQASEAAALLVRSDALHLDDFGTRQYVAEFDGSAVLLLILDNFLDVLLDGCTLRERLIVAVTLVRVLVALYSTQK